jgi:hypothetical protein
MQKDYRMEKTLIQWKAILMNDLQALQQHKKLDQISQERFALKEREIGFHCYQAEESLTDGELILLKKGLGLSELRWLYYKSRLRPGSV